MDMKPDDDQQGRLLAITVAICTHNRTDKIERALKSLARQDLAPCEILVVDNAPATDNTKNLLPQKFPHFRYVCEPIAGLDFARNRAIAEAQEEIIAFLDDDAVAAHDWTEKIYRVFQTHERAALCTGKTDPLTLQSAGELLFETNGGYGRGEQKVILPQDAHRKLHGFPVPLIAWAVSVGNGTNFAVRKNAVRELGGFDEAFDLGEALHGGGDLDMFWRVLEAGHELVYEPQALVRHEHRKEVEAVAWQVASHQRALVAFLKKSFHYATGYRKFSLLLFLTWRLLKPGVRLIARLIGRDALPVKIILKIWWESLRGLFAYKAARRVAIMRKREAMVSATSKNLLPQRFCFEEQAD